MEFVCNGYYNAKAKNEVNTQTYLTVYFFIINLASRNIIVITTNALVLKQISL